MNNKTNIKEDICAQQQKIIATLRHDNAKLIETNTQQAQRIEYLQEEVKEYRDLKSAFGNNGNLTYYQAMAVVQTRQNAVIERDRNMINSQRQGELEALRSNAHDEEVKAVLKESPDLLRVCNEDKSKAEQRRDMLLEKCISFYNMDEQQLRDYTRISHDIEKSAVNHIINEYQKGGNVFGGKPAYFTYECDYCEKTMTSLSSAEEHCWNNGDTHRDVNLNYIRREATETINASTKRIRYRSRENNKIQRRRST